VTGNADNFQGAANVSSSNASGLPSIAPTIKKSSGGFAPALAIHRSNIESYPKEKVSNQGKYFETAGNLSVQWKCLK
jgi:hypothetical protein